MPKKTNQLRRKPNRGGTRSCNKKTRRCLQQKETLFFEWAHSKVVSALVVLTTHGGARLWVTVSEVSRGVAPRRGVVPFAFDVEVGDA